MLILLKKVSLVCAAMLCLACYQSAFSQTPLAAKYDYKNSPYTGYTREHWLRITEKIISGALAQFNPASGLPEFDVAPLDPGYELQRMKEPEESKKRALERIMMAVVIYTKATGKDNVPGYNSSISQPFIHAMISGTDPKDPGYWGEPKANDQVGSTFALAAYIEPKRYWDPLTAQQKTNLLNYFKKQVYNTTYNNNHYFFHMVPVSLLERSGMEGNREHLTKMYSRLMGWYRGDGWFIDGNNRGFDYYNLWGFQLFNQLLYKYDTKWHNQFGSKVRETTGKFLKTLPYLFSRDGAPVPWGRSLSYRFAENSAIAWAVINHMSTIPPGQARRIASGALKYFYEHGCLNDKNLLTIGYWGANASVAEPYLDYGDPYWATHGLSCLLIPANDPFWTDAEKPIPADLAGGRKAVPGAQFTLRVSPKDGEARLYPVGQPWARDRNSWQIGSKYDQHAYSGFLGFCVQGEGSDEIGAGRSGYSYDGKNWFYRSRAEPVLVSADHIISRYRLNGPDVKDAEPYYNRDEITTHTLIGNDGEIHIFWHNNPDPIYLYLGGYGISAANAQAVNKAITGKTIAINAGRFHSLIAAVNAPDGKLDEETLIPRKGWTSTHLYGGIGAFPYWKSTQPVPPNAPVMFYVNGTRDRKAVKPKIEVQKKGNVLNVKFEDKWYGIQVPF